MIERKYWAEGHRVEHSAQKICAECSTSFRVWFLCIRGFPLALAFVFLFLSNSINDVNHITAKGEVFGGGFKMLGTHIFFPLCIGPLQRRCDQLHQMVHDHTPTFLWRQSRDE